MGNRWMKEKAREIGFLWMWRGRSLFDCCRGDRLRFERMEGREGLCGKGWRQRIGCRGCGRRIKEGFRQFGCGILRSIFLRRTFLDNIKYYVLLNVG